MDAFVSFLDGSSVGGAEQRTQYLIPVGGGDKLLGTKKNLKI